MRQKLLRVLVMYKGILLWSFAINILILVLKPIALLAIATKFLVAIMLLNSINSDHLPPIPDWLKNIRFNQISTLIWLFMIDSLFTFLFFGLMKVYV